LTAPGSSATRTPRTTPNSPWRRPKPCGAPTPRSSWSRPAPRTSAGTPIGSAGTARCSSAWPGRL